MNPQQTGGEKNAPSPMVTGLLPVVRKYLAQSMAAPVRQKVSGLWAVIRTKIPELEATLPRSSTPRGETTDPPSSPQRPPTSDSVLARRVDRDEELDSAIAAHQVSDGILEVLSSLPIQWVRSKLQENRNLVAERGAGRYGPSVTGGTECWIPNQASGHSGGYVRYNLRNTKHPTRPGKIGENPYWHQLALVADDRFNQLRICRVNSGWSVSHLCNNSQCMRPAHLIVEKHTENIARQGCKFSYAVKFEDGSIFHPCPHGRAGGPRCILPIWTKPAGKSYYTV